jgi:hypothetical protein
MGPLEDKTGYMEIKTMKKIIAVMMVIMLLLCTGCFYRYGRCVYHCNPDNSLGFKAAYLRGDHITFKFDEEYAFQETGWRKFTGIFKTGEFPSRWRFYLIMDQGEYLVQESDNITVDSENMTISFDKVGATTYDVRGFTISTGGESWSIDFDEGVIRERYMGGEMETYVTQHHDSKDDFWYPVETLNNYYPMTES